MSETPNANPEPPIRKQGRRAWERQPDEPAKMFVLFQKYLHLGVDRSLVKIHENVLHKSIPLKGLEKIANAFSWQSRTELYDLWRASMLHQRFEASLDKKEIDEIEAVNLLARVALLSVSRTLERLRKERPTIVKRDSHGKPVRNEKGNLVRTRNPHYAPAERVVVELVKESTALIKLMKNAPGSLVEVERKESHDALLAKLTKMAEALAPKAPQAIGEPEALQVKRVEPEQEPQEPGPVADAFPYVH